MRVALSRHGSPERGHPGARRAAYALLALLVALSLAGCFRVCREPDPLWGDTRHPPTQPCQEFDAQDLLEAFEPR